MTKTFRILLFLFILVACCAGKEPTPVHAADEPVYIGSKACGECHPDQFETFQNSSKKANSYTSIQRMAAKLTPEERKGCYGCHTTGYGRHGGFRSEQETPHLKNVGCEVCHGPGSQHSASEDPDDLKTVIDVDDCMICHNSERVAVFNFKPLLYGGAH